ASGEMRLAVIINPNTSTLTRILLPAIVHLLVEFCAWKINEPFAQSWIDAKGSVVQYYALSDRSCHPGRCPGCCDITGRLPTNILTVSSPEIKPPTHQVGKKVTKNQRI
ncbi:MAG: hypothetical protein WBF05_00435, partial [Anaerolineales bacterium]